MQTVKTFLKMIGSGILALLVGVSFGVLMAISMWLQYDPPGNAFTGGNVVSRVAPVLGLLIAVPILLSLI